MAENAAAQGSGSEYNFKLYRYSPSLPAAVVSLVVFGILTGLHSLRLLRARAFYFLSFTIGGLFQTIGYGGRIWSHYDDLAIGGFVMQAILILIAPALYAASIYMILSRLVRTVGGEHLCLVPVRWLTRAFVIGDIISFSLQAGGGGIQSGGTLQLYQTGEKIIVAGLICQILVFGFFVTTSALFHRRLIQSPTAKSRSNSIPWRRHLYVLYITSGLILVRSVFRVVEYLQGNDGYLISHEIFLYVFDTMLMALVMVIFLMYYIQDLLGSCGTKPRERLEMANSQHYEIEGART
ncbi:hypothetical protein LTR84_004235 [Exophiala bonariae]|uniref:RTA1 domain protein n=1 Tax=Exophiala bonariae TaxID=1690606 RepID=A0AAV9N469_9EURO|nr:hypothetical protein LTR84_004235 [Exophiala bonariae]